MFPHVTSNTSEQAQTRSKTNTGKCEVHQCPHKEVISLSLMQVVGGNSTLPKVKTVDGLQTSEMDWVTMKTGQDTELRLRYTDRLKKWGAKNTRGRKLRE
jgi:hypothetical protein